MNVAGVKRPDCDVNPALQKTDSIFVFAPAVRSGHDVLGDVRRNYRSVFSPPIPDNSMLYSCRVAIPTTTALGRYPLACGGPNSAKINSRGTERCRHVQRRRGSSSSRCCRAIAAATAAVSVDELVLGVNISLGLRPITDCLAFDTDFNGRVSVDELIKAVNAALNT